MMIVAALGMQACAGHPSRATVAHRMQTGQGCATADIQARLQQHTPAKFLSSGGQQFEPSMRELRLQCATVYQIDDAYTVACTQSIVDVLAVLNQRLTPPVTIDVVRFEPHSTCVDTNISGCEAWDCTTWLEAVVPTAGAADAARSQ
jgi:hypothetical protein